MNVYLANQTGSSLYKIGITKKAPKERLRELQVGNAAQLALVEAFTTKHSYKLESALHNHYKTKKVNSEWFELTDDQVQSFLSVCQTIEASIAFLKQSGNPFI